MKRNERITVLLHALRGLHASVSTWLWSRRLQRHRRHSGADIELDIAAGLSASIDELAYRNSIEAPQHAGLAVAQGSQRSPRNTASRASGPPQRSAAAGGERGDLARHFGADHVGSALHGEALGGLRKRTWEHIHAALRSARQGDARNARLHAELANAAFAEARHYMSREEFAEFAAKVREKLK